jgi:hypothetical protein
LRSVPEFTAAHVAPLSGDRKSVPNMPAAHVTCVGPGAMHTPHSDWPFGSGFCHRQGAVG